MIKKLTIDEYCRRYASALKPFEEFLTLIGVVNWKASKDIVTYFGSNKVRTIGGDRLRFEIGGNNHRVIVSYFFGKKNVTFFIKFIVTLEEYNQIDEKTVDLY